eukprot:CAMPEP_0175140128 /NCGR_PEP_ID=MMETSP0087-20121206/11289_1 /TAXON_ID=136419 /ORGANISM="Unknown Unknown, Strain D1" /LENGTH=240 /DNA_ID=CAMNT_0016423221 /DNA_START=41 /DNA_END=763 /DNA_ORIENTATION=+
MTDQYLNVHTSWAYNLWRPETCAASIVGYLMLIAVIKSVMKTREAFELTNVMRVYNFLQVALCCYMCYGLASNPFSNFFRINVDYNPKTEYFLFVHFLSKWLDFVDTIVMALRKKDRQITVLHVFHHSSIPAVWSCLLFFGQAYGTTSLGAFANSFIHVIMYSHYFVTSFGIRNPFKKVVTQAQLIQFGILLLHSFVALIWEQKIGGWFCFLQTVYQITMLAMFGSFYKKSYTPAAKKVE